MKKKADGPRCEKPVFSGYRHYPCGNSAKVERDGKHYCNMHDPVRVAEKYKARAEENERQMALVRKNRQLAKEQADERERRAALYPELVAALRMAKLGFHAALDPAEHKKSFVGYAIGVETIEAVLAKAGES